MKSFFFLSNLSLCLMTSLAIAQSTTPPATTPPAAKTPAPAVTITTTPPAAKTPAPATATTPAAPGQPDMAKLMENVNQVAKDLQANLTDLETSIQNSRNSIEKGAEVLNEMLASVTAVHKSMADDSAIWKELESLLELWEKRRKETLQKSESNPAFVPVAKAWEEKIKMAKDLRKQISTERANSVSLMRSIESDREIVLSYYELGQADKAVEGLKKVSANLSNLNSNMQNIVKTASSVQQQPIPQ